MTLSLALLVAILVVTVPGFVVGYVAGMKVPWALTAALPMSFGVYGLADWIYGISGQGFTVGSVIGVWALLLLLAALWRASAVYRRGRAEERMAFHYPGVKTEKSAWRPGSLLDEHLLIPATGAAVGSVLLIGRAASLLAKTPDGMNNIFQGPHGMWQANIVRYIVDRHNASPTQMGDLFNLESHQQMYYPVGLHSGAAMLALVAKISPIAALNVTLIAVVGIGLPLSTAVLTWKMVGGRGLTAQIAGALAAMSAVAMPSVFWGGQAVGSWPFLAGISMAGIVATVLMTVPYRPVTAFPAVLALVGLGQVQGAAAMDAIVIVVLWWIAAGVWNPAEIDGFSSRLRDVGILAATIMVGVLIVVPQLSAGARDVDSLNGSGAPQVASDARAWREALLLRNGGAAKFFENVDLTVILALGLVGLVVLLVWRRNLWAPLAWLVGVASLAYSLSPSIGLADIVFGPLVRMHYSDPHRLIKPVEILVFCFASIAIAATIRVVTLAPVENLVQHGADEWRRGTAAATVAVSLIVGGVLVAWNDSRMAQGQHVSVAQTRDNHRVSEADRRAWDWLAKQPHAYDGLIFTSPDDGSGWMYAYNGLPSLFRSERKPPLDKAPATERLISGIDRLGAGQQGNRFAHNPVDDAALQLGVKYIVASSGSVREGATPDSSLYRGLQTSPGVTPVYQDSTISIFAVNQVFTQDELRGIRAAGGSPDPLPDLPESR